MNRASESATDVRGAAHDADFKPFDPAFSDDPYRVYAALRASTPIFSVPGCLGRDWIFTRHADVRSILNDDRFAVDNLPARIRGSAGACGATGRTERLCKALEAWLFFMNGPAHAVLRRAVAQALSRADGAQTLERALAVDVERLLSGLLRDGALDIIADVARPLPAMTMARLLDLREPGSPRLADMASALFGVFTQPLPMSRYIAMDAELAEFSSLLEPVVESRRRTPAQDVISLLVSTGSQSIAPGQVLGALAMLFAVAQDTTQNMIGNAIAALLDHPDAAETLAAEPGRLDSAVRELARFDSPVQLVVRIATDDVKCGGALVHKGERAHLFLGAAHRDPAVYRDPDRIDLNRPRLDPLPFGCGPHFCLGQHLALMQTKAVLQALLPSLGRLRRRGPAADRLRSLHVRGLRSLQVALAANAAD